MKNKKNGYSYRFVDRNSVEEYLMLYDDKKNSYANIINNIEINILKEIILSQNNTLQKNYLDFATGTGRIISELENYFDNSHGIDISSEMIGACSERVSKSKLICGDITSMPIDSLYDIITAFRFFLNAEQELREIIIKELYNRLNEDGKIIINNHGRPISMNIIGYIGRIIGYQNKQNILFDSHIINLIKANKMRVVKTIYYGIIGERLAQIIGHKNTQRIENKMQNGFISKYFGMCAIYIIEKDEQKNDII